MFVMLRLTSGLSWCCGENVPSRLVALGSHDDYRRYPIVILGSLFRPCTSAHVPLRAGLCTPQEASFQGNRTTITSTTLHALGAYANSVGFQGLVPLLPHFCHLSVPEVGVCGYIRKALEKGYLEHPGSACCTDDLFENFVRFGRCRCCLLPLLVNRQLPCPHTNSHHGLLLPPMHHNSLGCAKGLALGEHSGCPGFVWVKSGYSEAIARSG